MITDTHARIAFGIFAGAFVITQVEQVRTIRKNRRLVDRNKDLVKAYNDNVDDYNALFDRTQYVINKLVDKLEEEGIEVEDLFTEFDLIVLRSMGKLAKESA